MSEQDHDWAALVRELLAAMPDLSIMIDELQVTSEEVTLRWSARGTQRGAILGVPPSGRPVLLRGIAASACQPAARAWARVIEGPRPIGPEDDGPPPVGATTA